MSDGDPTVALLELTLAERDAALHALAALERIVSRETTFLPARDQVALLHARSLLVQHGLQKAPKRHGR